MLGSPVRAKTAYLGHVRNKKYYVLPLATDGKFEDKQKKKVVIAARNVGNLLIFENIRR